MGGGWAECAARAARGLALRSRQKKTADAMLAALEKSLAKQVEKGKLEETDAKETLGRVTATAHLGDLANCDLVIENIVEDLAPKKELSNDLDQDSEPHTTPAT